MTIIKNIKCDPYDEIWESELMKADKKEIIEMLRKTAKDRDILNAELRLSDSLPVEWHLSWQCMNCGKVNDEQNCECRQ